MAIVIDFAQKMAEYKASIITVPKQPEQSNYCIGSVSLVMSLPDQINLIRTTALERVYSQSGEAGAAALNVSRLTHIVEHVFKGIVMPFGGTRLSAQENVELNKNDGYECKLIVTHVPITELENSYTTKILPKHTFTVTVGIFTIEKAASFSATRLPLKNIDVVMNEKSNVAAKTLVYLLRNADELARTSNGTTLLADDGTFLVAIPYSETAVYLIAVVNDIPFKLKEIAAPGK